MSSETYRVTLPQKDALTLTTSFRSKAACTEVLTCHRSPGKGDYQMEKQLFPTSQERCSHAQIYKANSTFTHKYTKAVKHELVHRHTFRNIVFPFYSFFRKIVRVFVGGFGFLFLVVFFARHYLHKYIQRYIATIHPLPHTVTYHLMERCSTPTHNTPTLERWSQA